MRELDGFGLTEREKGMNLHCYNHALFQNMMFFMDIVWEINILTGTVVILMDKNEPNRNSTQFVYRRVYREYMKDKISREEQAVFEQYMNPDILKEMKEEVSFDIRLHLQNGEWELHRIVLTPSFDENERLSCVYLGARNLQSEASRELAKYHIQEQSGDAGDFREPAVDGNCEPKRTISQEQQLKLAVLSGSLLVYNINLTRDLIEEEFYEMVDGEQYPMLQMMGMSAPCSFNDFAQQWGVQKVLESSRQSFLEMYNREYMLEAYRRGERQLEMEFDTVLGRGIQITIRNTVLLLEDKRSGDILATVSGRDISAKKQEKLRQQQALKEAYEAANNASVAKTEFLTRISHDIRTPMNAIIGMTAIAEKHQDDGDRVADCLKRIAFSGKYLLTLLDEMLDMSMIESGRMKLQEEEIDLVEVFENLNIILGSQVRERGCAFNASILSVEHRKVLGDRKRIDQIVMNLVDNASKYTLDEGSIRMTLEEKPTNKEDIGCYEIVVEDNGIGMSRELVQSLFEPFVRGKDRRVEKIAGSGLGLAITNNIVKMLNGTIWVNSEPEAGTRVTVKIFLKLQKKGDISHTRFAEEARMEEKTPIQALTERDFSGNRVLMVEDNESNADIIREILEMVGLEVEQAWNGREAVEMIATAKDWYYGVVFMDIQMPVMDGYEATRAIRQLNSAYAREVPILAMSANAFAEDVQTSLAAGMNEHISKPIDFRKLGEALHRWLPENPTSEDQ